MVSYDSFPAVVDPELAMTGKPTVIHEGFPNNLAVPLVPSGTGVSLDGKSVDDTAVDRAFAQAEVIIKQRMLNQRLVPNAMEPRGVVAHFEPGKGTMTIWSSTQNPHILRTMIAAMIGMGQDQVRAIAPEVGGGFGAKINIYGEEYVAAAVSKRLGIPVKWIEDRSEAFVATTHGRDILGYVELAAKRDGTVLGLKMRLIADIGAYNMLLTAAIPTLTMLMANATYDIPAIRTTLTEVFTNKTPTDAYRGAGRPEATYFVERAMDMLARELNMDPAEVRRKNFIASNKFPFQTQMGAVYDSGDYAKALDAALLHSKWNDLKKERDAAKAQGRLVGLGLSMYVEVCGIGPSATLPTGGWEHAQVTVERDGRISATTGASPHGQGNETTFGQMLGRPIWRAHRARDDPSRRHQRREARHRHVRQPLAGGRRRGAAHGGHEGEEQDGEVRRCPARSARRRSRVRERHDLGEGRTGARQVVRRRRGLRVHPGAACPKASSRESARKRSSSRPTTPIRSAATSRCSRSIARLASRRCCKLVAVDDAGNLINPLIVEGQIHGGLAQGIGQAMIEEAVYNSDGQLVTGSFMDYALPRAIDFPRFELHSTVTPTPVNPLGAKGVGEAGTLGSTPSIVSAAVDALSEFGVKHIDMMLRPEKLWRIIHREGPGVIPTTFDYQRATSIDDALAKLQAASGGKLIAGGHSLVPLMKLRLSEPIGADRRRPDSGPLRDQGEGREDRDRRRHHASRRRHVDTAQTSLPRCRRDRGRDRRSAGAQPRHARRQPRPCGPGGRLPCCDAGRRRGDSHQRPEGMAQGQGERLLPGALHRGPGARRDHRWRSVHAGQGGRLRQASPARLALRHRRRRRGCGGEGRGVPVGARRADRREHARDSPDSGRAGTGREAGDEGQASRLRQPRQAWTM